MQYPCKGCTERYRACHDSCEKYLAVKEKNDAAREAKQKYYDINDYIVGTIRKQQNFETKRRRENRHHVR